MTIKNFRATKQFGWKLAKILKHGYTNFDNFEECVQAIHWLGKNKIVITQKEIYRETDTKDYIIEPNKTHVKQISNLLDKRWGIGLLSNLI